MFYTASTFLHEDASTNIEMITAAVSDRFLDGVDQAST